MLPGRKAVLMARPAKARIPAFAYLRTSSATNVGADKDSGDWLVATGTPGAQEAARAYFSRNGQPYSAKSVRAKLAQRLVGGANRIVVRVSRTDCYSSREQWQPRAAKIFSSRARIATPELNTGDDLWSAAL